MGRFLLGLVVAGLAFYGYERYRGEEAAAATVTDPPSSEPDEVAGLVDRRPPPVEARAESTPAAPAPAKPAPAVSFAALLAASGPLRNDIAAQLVTRGRSSAGVAGVLELLGNDNTFLRCPEGRELGRLALQRALDEPDPEQGIRGTTALLELAIHGGLDEHGEEFVRDAYTRHLALVRQVPFNPANLARAKVYEVQSGDNLDRIARRYRKTHGLRVEAGTLQIVNRIRSPRQLHVGQMLRIPVDPVRAVVEKRSFYLAVYLGDSIVRLYRCAHGKPGQETPVTTFTIQAKIDRPDWQFEGRKVPYGHPDNPLGTHFIKFEPNGPWSGFGVHGTWQPESLGTRASLGCIRLHNDHIAEFARFVPHGATVEIRG